MKRTAFYGLEVESENFLFGKKQVVIYVFPNLVSSEVWATLEKESYENQKYLFYCEKRVRGWRLREWREIEKLKIEL